MTIAMTMTITIAEVAYAMGAPKRSSCPCLKLRRRALDWSASETRLFKQQVTVQHVGWRKTCVAVFLVPRYL